MRSDEGKGTEGGKTAWTIEERLGRHFEAELSRAQLDYPRLQAQVAATAQRQQASGRRVWPSLIAVPLGALAMVVVILLVAPLLMPVPSPVLPPGPGTATPPTPAATSPAPAGSGVVLGTDGIPNEIAGEHVYRLAAQHDWQGLERSFLLGAYAVNEPIPCPSARPPSAAPEEDLLPLCGIVELIAQPAEGNEFFMALAPRSLEILTPWLRGPAIVMRAHTNDPEAASCADANRDACAAALVVEAIVWSGPTGSLPGWSVALGEDGVPTDISGQKVYRARDAASFPTKESFLLGGPVTMPDLIPPCPQRLGVTDAENNLVPYCVWTAVDGIRVAPKGVALTDYRGWLVVVRVHVNDTEAVHCPVAIRPSCAAALVVDGIVWTGGRAAATSTPGSPTPTPHLVRPEAGSLTTPPVPPTVPVLPAS